MNEGVVRAAQVGERESSEWFPLTDREDRRVLPDARKHNPSTE